MIYKYLLSVVVQFIKKVLITQVVDETVQVKVD